VVFDPERMIEPISVRWLIAAAAREGALELLRAFSASMPRRRQWTQPITWRASTFTRKCWR
jgi:hypothetical protein